LVPSQARPRAGFRSLPGNREPIEARVVGLLRRILKEAEHHRDNRSDLVRARALYEQWMALATRLDLGMFAKVALATLAMEESRFTDAEALVGAIGGGPGAERAHWVSVAADGLLAWSLAEQGKIEAASDAIGRARSGIRGIEIQRLRLHVATVGAVVDGFSGDSARVTEAFAQLDAVDQETAKTGALRAALWARYARGRLELRAGRARDGRHTLDALAKDASEKGMMTLARLATNARTAKRAGP
jgi:hypothetical protein